MKQKRHKFAIIIWACWVCLTLAGAGGLIARQVYALTQQLKNDSKMVLWHFNAKIDQYNGLFSILKMLPPNLALNQAQLLRAMQAVAPELQALGCWGNHGWQGAPNTLMPPATLYQQARTAQHDIFDPIDADHYWLQHASGWALLISTSKLLDIPQLAPSLQHNVSMRIQCGGFHYLWAAPALSVAGWPIQITLNSLPLHGTSNRLSSERILTLHDMPFFELLAWLVLVLLMIAAFRGYHLYRVAARQEQHSQRLANTNQLSILEEMVTGMSHILNQPLTAIIAHISTVKRLLDTPNAQIHRALHAGIAQANRATAVIQRVHRLTLKNEPVVRTAIQPEVLINHLLFSRQVALAKQGITLSWHNQAPGAQLLAAAVMVEQILYHLVQNACDALLECKQAGTIQIIGLAHYPHYILQVKDNGPGLSADAQTHLYTPFFSTRKHKMGLGLPLCTTLANRLDAKLAICNAPEGGVIAQLTLPLAL